MPDRLQELLRQRALIQEHLAWLDREIGAARSGLPPFAPLPPAPALPELPQTAPALPEPADEPPPLPKRPVASDAAAIEADEAELQAEKILGQFQREPRSLEQDARKGCLRAFMIGMGLFIVATGIAYALYAHHLGRWW